MLESNHFFETTKQTREDTDLHFRLNLRKKVLAQEKQVIKDWFTFYLMSLFNNHP